MDAPAGFGTSLRQLRVDRGLSIRDLARQAHHSKSVVWEWEQGRKMPPADAVARLDRILDARGDLTAAFVNTAETVIATDHEIPEAARQYAHQRPVAAEIRRRATEAAQLDVMAVRALGLIGLNDSLLRPALIARTKALAVRILLLDPDCAAATCRAEEIGESPASFSAGIQLTIARLAEVTDSGIPIDLDVRLYTRRPVWRIIRVDDLMWVSTFDSQWEGHASTIYEIPRTPRGAFWAGFHRQFEDMHANARRII